MPEFLASQADFPLNPPTEAEAGAVLSVNVGAVVNNWHKISDMIGPNCECGAVFKGDAYGLGMVELARALAKTGCRTFFVAHIIEGIRLRQIIPMANIIVFNGLYSGTEDVFLAHDLIPCLGSPEQVELWRVHAARRELELPAVLRIDTGMTRFGLDEVDYTALAEDPSLMAGVRPTLLLSHLACAYYEGNPMTPLQREKFLKARKLFPHLPCSLAASSGVMLGGDYHFDIVRPGAALLGMSPVGSARFPHPFEHVVDVKARIIQIRDVRPGQYVGYGSTYRITEPSRIATASIGYADGFPDELSNRGYGFVNGVRVEIVGLVSMDMTTFDITNLPPGAINVGDYIDLINKDYTFDNMGEDARSNAIKLMSRLTRRYYVEYTNIPSLTDYQGYREDRIDGLVDRRITTFHGQDGF